MASLCDLSKDILISIALLLSYRDLVQLATLCKTLRRVAVTVVQLQRRRNIPWLMTINRYDKTFKCELYDFQLKQSVSLSRIIGSQLQELLRNGSIVASKYGWLLVTYSRCPTSPAYCLCSPLTNQIIELPPVGSHDYFLGATFSGPPTCSGCVVFVICRRGLAKANRGICSISTCNPRERRWTTNTYNVSPKAELRDVAYVDGSFYCAFTVGSTLHLGTFNVESQDWAIVVTVIKPSNLSYQLVDYGGELLLIAMPARDRFLRRAVHTIACRQFDRLRKKWTRIKSLGNQIIFCSEMGSMVVPADEVVSDFSNMVRNFGLSNTVRSTYTTEGDGKCHQLETWGSSTVPIWIEPLYLLERSHFKWMEELAIPE